MEPRLIETLRNKIQTFESQPARWAREETWDRIRMQQKKIRYPYYGAAACILAVAVSVGYLVVNNNQGADMIQPKPTTTVVEKETPEKNLKLDPQPEHAPVAKKITAKKVIKENPVWKNNTAESAIEAETAHITFDKPTNVFVPKDPTPLTAAMTEQKEPETQSVQVVIGIIPRVSEDQVASNAGKKMKFKVMKSSGQKSRLKISDERMLIIARIK